MYDTIIQFPNESLYVDNKRDEILNALAKLHIDEFNNANFAKVTYRELGSGFFVSTGLLHGTQGEALEVSIKRALKKILHENDPRVINERKRGQVVDSIYVALDLFLTPEDELKIAKMYYNLKA